MEKLNFLNTPIGNVYVSASQYGISSIGFTPADHVANNYQKYVDEGLEQLREYFVGRRKVFDLTLHTNGTVFQRSVWRKLRDIPFSQTISYMNLAQSLGDEKLTRAVGAASGANPIAIINPCHRVIGTNGELTGYAGGIDRKAWLLSFEQGSIIQTLF